MVSRPGLFLAVLFGMSLHGLFSIPCDRTDRARDRGRTCDRDRAHKDHRGRPAGAHGQAHAMTKKQDERRSFSYHEAGHAVVAWSLGFRVSKVSIGMDGNDGPVTEVDAVIHHGHFIELILTRGLLAV